MSEIPPPPHGVNWSDWGERLNAFLQRNLYRLNQLRGGESAAENGYIAWDRSIEHPVVSYNGKFIPLGYGANEPDQGYGYGAFVDFNDQAATTINTATAITFGTTAHSNGISVGTPTSRIVFANAGRYYVHFTAQLKSESASAKTFWFWPRVNGTDVTGSTMRISLHDNDQAKTVARAAIFQVSAGDYLEAMFAVSDLDTSLEAYAAESFAPAVPSVTLMAKSV